MKTIVSFAFRGQQLVVRPQALLEDRHAERVPQEITVLITQA